MSISNDLLTLGISAAIFSSTSINSLSKITIFDNNKLCRFKRYKIFTIGGSELKIDKSKSNGEYFKSRSNFACNKTSARISILFDVLSNFVMDAQIGSLEMSERTFAVHNLEYFSERFDNNDINQIAKVANSTQSIYVKDSEDMKKSYEYLETFFENYLLPLKEEVL